MKSNKWVFISLATLFSIIASCNKAKIVKSCIQYKNAAVTKIEGPTSGNVNQVLNLTVFFGCFNGCGQFGSFEQTTTGNLTTINVIAKYEGCICTQDAPIRQTVYNFKATEPGVYNINFEQTQGSYLTHTIIIQ